ncbi:unnamed protein product [Phyllotreta striolata]|uniref:MAGE domain-containing protein n=1 Tax=Phyllotreta striolata TaxID=444603 RepID=A0A9N9TMM8_PHYSR|nr:unnamed protein product [Phyllotreta striolata]
MSSQRRSKRSQNLSQSQRCSQDLFKTQTQLVKDEYMVDMNIEEQINKLVQYFVIRAGENSIFKQSDLKKILPQSGRSFQDILEGTKRVLSDVYGFNVNTLDAKTYSMSNALPYIRDPTESITERNLPADVNNILVMLVLSHIFMSNNSVGENSMYQFLLKLGIDVERKHEVFGNVKEFILVKMKNDKYLNIEKNTLTNDLTFSWGAKAEKEISKHKILKFVCTMHNNATSKNKPSSWVTQHEAANTQQMNNDVTMIDDE